MVRNRSDSDILGSSAVVDADTAARLRGTWLKPVMLQEAVRMSSELAAIATDATGLIQFFNRGAERMLGYSAAELVNCIEAVDIHDPQDIEARARSVSRDLLTTITPGFEALTCKASRSGEDRYVATLFGKNREPVSAEVVISALRDDFGSIAGFLLTVTDVTVRSQAGPEPRELGSSTEHDDLSRFALLAHLSHEMRTPLTAILGFSQLMKSAAHAPTLAQNRSLDLILEAGWHLENILNMTRDLALIESGALSLSVRAVPLAAVMRDCQAMIEPQALKRGVRVTFPALATQCLVSADRNRLLQVVANRLSAAIERAALDEAMIVECEILSPEWLRIGITHGPDRLLTARPARSFQQAAVPRGASTAGDDIGLLLARRLVELMGGTIGPEGNAGSGQVFSVDLKRMPASVDEVLQPEVIPFNASATSAANAITRQIT